ncbi:uncharacterized protein DDB_G0283697 [Neltuma alba]|uniref:uncharacterized protein DDB_G0283697 n=1 Tax=Neltuma alba TaxID=207710 RepID=UPI0010A393BB|nr:uncharacterized protein DDB_G0283697-like [Prosopis alba]
MAEEAPETETPKKDTEVDARHIESQIQTAMRSRVAHFKEQADSLTFEGVRRLLEKDLGLEPYALDVHKRFVKQCLLKSLEGVGDDKSPKVSGDTGEKGTRTQEKEGSTEEILSKKDVKTRCTDNEDKMEDSPVLGLLNEEKSVKLETKEAEGNDKNAIPSETMIKKAIRKRSSYVKANSEKVTMAGLRRLLEEDLKLEKFCLDPYKKLISQHLEEVLKSCEASKPANSAKKIVKKKPDAKATKKVSSEESSDDSDVEEEEEQEDEIKPRKRSIPKGKLQNSLEPKKRKGSPEETELSAKKRIKSSRKASEDSRDAEDSGKDSEDDQSQSSPEKITKKKEVSTPAYGKQVEHLKSVIKACGMSVPPVIYRRVKQVPENKREAQLIKEMEEILSKEGLSSNPSEKEIKDVKRKKERAKELEGIDVSNIVSSSRRRSTASFAVPPKAKEPVETKTNGDDVENSGDDNDDESNDDEEDEDEEEENSGDDDDGSQSEEVNEDEEDSD